MTFIKQIATKAQALPDKIEESILKIHLKNSLIPTCLETLDKNTAYLVPIR